MTQEEKSLLLRDLCARLPNGVILHLKPEENDQVLYGMRMNGGKMLINDAYYIEEVIPYLRPMSSMTVDEYEIYHELIGGMFGTGILINLPTLEDFLNKNMFDYRGLIEKGLAIEVTKENNPYKE